jgi:hypothetical protein
MFLFFVFCFTFFLSTKSQQQQTIGTSTSSYRAGPPPAAIELDQEVGIGSSKWSRQGRTADSRPERSRTGPHGLAGPDRDSPEAGLERGQPIGIDGPPLDRGDPGRLIPERKEAAGQTQSRDRFHEAEAEPGPIPRGRSKQRQWQGLEDRQRRWRNRFQEAEPGGTDAGGPESGRRRGRNQRLAAAAGRKVEKSRTSCASEKISPKPGL